MRHSHSSIEILLPNTNAFQDTLLALEVTPGKAIDSFSAACLEVYENRDPDKPDYRLAQVFEPSVLDEVAFLRGLEPQSVATLEHAPNSRMRELLAEVTSGQPETSARSMNLASVLISISRFELAEQVLDSARTSLQSNRDRFEFAFLSFVIDNRAVGGTRSSGHFAAMRDAAESNQIPPGRLLDACTQAVVWYLKRREVAADDLAWFVRQGQKIVRESGRGVSAGAISSWYRGIAMLPARSGDMAKTRDLMHRAQRAADEVLSVSAHAYDLHLLKTYFESAMKEYMYVSPDLAMAEQTGHDLIALDPHWGPSWAELAEVYVHFGHVSEAASAFDTAAKLGSPWVRYALRSAGDLYRKLDERELALSRYYSLTLFPEVPLEVINITAELAQSVRPELVDELEDVRVTQQQRLGVIA